MSDFSCGMWFLKTKNLEIDVKMIGGGGDVGFDIQEEIMKRLPVKSLLRFRCVSKSWKSLIHSRKFIAAHHTHQQGRLLVLLPSGKFESIADKEFTYPQRFVPAPVPVSLELLETSSIVIVACSHGLFCFSGILINSQLSNPRGGNRMAIIWNPSIRESIPVALPYPNKSLTTIHEAVVGFGVCPLTTDPKMVAITQFAESELRIDRSGVWEADVCTLSSGKWISLPSTSKECCRARNKWYQSRSTKGHADAAVQIIEKKIPKCCYFVFDNIMFKSM